MGSRAKRKKTASADANARYTPRAHRERLAIGIVCVILAALVWIAFGQTIHHEFINYDDGDYVYENPNVSKGLTFEGIRWAFTHVHAANWHPLTTISHMLDCQLYGLQPWGHHLTNILLHTVAAILLFLALRKLTLALWPSAFVAVLFAVHPLRIESVAWISERKDVLSGVFFMLTLLAYASYARSERCSVRRYVLVVMLFALGLLCKPTLVTLPFVLLLLDYWPLGRWQGAKSEGQSENASTSQHLNISTSFRGLVVEKIPLFVLSALSCVATILAQEKVLATSLRMTLMERASNALTSYVAYLEDMIYPTRLVVLHPYAEHHADFTHATFACLLLLLISAACFLLHRKYPFLAVGWLWFVGMLVPMSGLVQVGLQARADRYTYLSQIGLYLAVTWGAFALLGTWRWSYAILSAICVITATALVACSRVQAAYWRNSEVLWEHTIEITSNNYIAYNNLGSALLRKGLPDAAVVQFQKALEIKPDYEDAYASAGSALMLMGQTDRAIGYYQKALELMPDAEAWSNLGSALLKKGQVDDAIQDYRKAVAIKPESADVQYNLGRALASSGDWNGAIACYEAALRIQPGYPKILNNLAVAFAEIGKTDEAVAKLREVLRINPNYPEAHYNLASILVHLGQRDEAITHLNEALRLKPDYKDAEKLLRELGVPPPP